MMIGFALSSSRAGKKMSAAIGENRVGVFYSFVVLLHDQLQMVSTLQMAILPVAGRLPGIDCF